VQVVSALNINFVKCWDGAYLETPDDLVAALIRHLALEVFPRTGLVLLLLAARILLRVVVDVGINALLQGTGTGAEALAGIDARGAARLLVTSGGVGEVLGIGRSAGVGGSSRLVRGVLDVLLRVASVETLGLLLQVVL
jgi:hypothetical protein